MKKVLPIFISVLLFLLGLAVMFYPTVSNWLHEQAASYAVSNYLEQTHAKSDEEFAAEFAAARAYNKTLTGDIESFMAAQIDAESQIQNPDYWNTLDQVDGIMGIIEIPTINVTLPIYHGTDESVLQKGTGHLEGSALPTGDVGNHTIITGHTGLPTAMLFTDLDELVIGDRFYLDILDQIFSYEITDIYVVLPSETEQLVAQKDRDLVTLVTCTPYGVNSHRLLIQGERIDEPAPDSLVASVKSEVLLDQQDTSSALDGLPTLVVVAVSLGALFFLSIVIFLVRHSYSAKRLSKQKQEKSPDTEQKSTDGNDAP